MLLLPENQQMTLQQRTSHFSPKIVEKTFLLPQQRLDDGTLQLWYFSNACLVYNVRIYLNLGSVLIKVSLRQKGWGKFSQTFHLHKFHLIHKRFQLVYDIADIYFFSIHQHKTQILLVCWQSMVKEIEAFSKTKTKGRPEKFELRREDYNA